ncbi:MAG: hypothetical protein M1823_000067 [Watsoniomyces obsoletus]|nr:MAG: hypothetical protein M1823_000067 [Watsoniomyces obsoletus]
MGLIYVIIDGKRHARVSSSEYSEGAGWPEERGPTPSSVDYCSLPDWDRFASSDNDEPEYWLQAPKLPARYLSREADQPRRDPLLANLEYIAAMEGGCGGHFPGGTSTGTVVNPVRPVGPVQVKMDGAGDEAGVVVDKRRRTRVINRMKKCWMKCKKLLGKC